MTSNTDAIWVNRAKKAMLLIRILVGWVFLSEGIQKFLFPESLGVGRFVKIGIPPPQLMAPFVGVTEIICGALLLVGLFTRLALRASAHRHLRGLVLDQDRRVHEEWVLGHAARSAHRCEHAAWPDLPTDCRGRNPGPRCTLSGRLGPQAIGLTCRVRFSIAIATLPPDTR